MNKKNMKRKILLWGIILFAGFIAIVVQLGLWNSSGGLLTFLQGQMDTAPDINTLKTIHSQPVDTKNTALVRLVKNQPVHKVAPEYLSFALDSSQLVGGKWWNPEAKKVEMGSGALDAPVFDFNRPLLDTLTQALHPAYLRIGGSEADKIYYDISSSLSKGEVPEGYHSVMRIEQWNQMNRFVRRNQLKLMFTLNVGPSSRNDDGSWNSKNAEELLSYAAENDHQIDIWELGNEVNLQWYIYGPGKQATAEQYAADLKAARKLVKQYYPHSQFSGQGSAYWPVFGEPLSFFFSFMPDYMALSGEDTDIVSWHYYPQQSRRGLIASRRATPSRLLNPDNLDEIQHWAEKINHYRDQYAPGKPIWMGETGNAQFGGEPGVSDRYIGGLWWMDQLGLLAKNKHSVVVRQTLAGMNYGMLDPVTLEPNPDYWNSVIWKMLMGQQVFDATIKTESNDRSLRVYAHSHPQKENAVTFLFINLNHESSQQINLPDYAGKEVEVFHMDTPDLTSKEVRLNGKVLRLEGNSLPKIEGKKVSEWDASLKVKPLSYSFVTVY
jgi:heparanase 1